MVKFDSPVERSGILLRRHGVFAPDWEAYQSKMFVYGLEWYDTLPDAANGHEASGIHTSAIWAEVAVAGYG